MNQRPPEKLSDPWLFDSESLLRELDRCRELVLEIPITNPNATHFGINVAVTAIWNLRENLRYLLALHREGQRAFAKQTAEAVHKQQKKTAAHPASKIVGIKNMAVWQAADLTPFPPNHERQLLERICKPWPNRPRPIPQPTGHMSPPFTRAAKCPRAPCEGAEKLPND